MFRLCAFGIIGGISYIFISLKPTKKSSVKIIGVNGLSVTAEFSDGTRKNLTLFSNKIIIKPEDIGVIGYKGSFIMEFDKQI